MQKERPQQSFRQRLEFKIAEKIDKNISEWSDPKPTIQRRHSRRWVLGAGLAAGTAAYFWGIDSLRQKAMPTKNSNTTFRPNTQTTNEFFAGTVQKNERTTPEYPITRNNTEIKYGEQVRLENGMVFWNEAPGVSIEIDVQNLMEILSKYPAFRLPPNHYVNFMFSAHENINQGLLTLRDIENKKVKPLFHSGAFGLYERSGRASIHIPGSMKEIILSSPFLNEYPLEQRFNIVLSQEILSALFNMIGQIPNNNRSRGDIVMSPEDSIRLNVNPPFRFTHLDPSIKTKITEYFALPDPKVNVSVGGAEILLTSDSIVSFNEDTFYNGMDGMHIALSTDQLNIFQKQSGENLMFVLMPYSQRDLEVAKIKFETQRLEELKLRAKIPAHIKPRVVMIPMVSFIKNAYTNIPPESSTQGFHWLSTDISYTYAMQKVSQKEATENVSKGSHPIKVINFDPKSIRNILALSS